MVTAHKGLVYSKHQASTERLVVQADLHGQPWGQWMLAGREDFKVGWGSHCQVPMGEDFVPAADFALVALRDGVCQFHLTQKMHASLFDAGTEIVANAESVELRQNCEARIVCGALTFKVAWLPPPPVVGKPTRQGGLVPWPLRLVTTALLSVAGMLWMVPSDPKALTVWDNERVVRLLPVTVIPAVEPTPPAGPARTSGASGAGTTQPQQTIRPSRTRPVVARSSKAGDVGPAPDRVGILQVISQLGTVSGTVAGIFADSPDEGDLEQALIGLTQPSLLDGFATGGLQVSQPSANAGATVGDGTLKTIGICADGKRCNNQPHGAADHLAALRARRQARLPAVAMVPCAPSSPGCGAHGALDKEVVRRAIRRHINEIKFCYEQQLVRNPKLAGRVAVRFVISPAGTVLASAIAESSLSNAHVETCVAQAVKRWQFPVAQQAGTTVVTYPFAFSPAGG